MKTKQWILLTAIALLGCTPGGEVDEGEAPQAQRPPNVVLIVADDLGWRDVSFNGGEIATPNIDRIASEGVRLDRFYVAPICSPTRAGLMTGRHPIRYGMMRGVVMGYHDYGLDPEATIVPQVLAEAGYEHRAWSASGIWVCRAASTTPSNAVSPASLATSAGASTTSRTSATARSTGSTTTSRSTSPATAPI